MVNKHAPFYVLVYIQDDIVDLRSLSPMLECRTVDRFINEGSYGRTHFILCFDLVISFTVTYLL